jgi:hypothetical protein
MSAARNCGTASGINPTSTPRDNSPKKMTHTLALAVVEMSLQFQISSLTIKLVLLALEDNGEAT